MAASTSPSVFKSKPVRILLHLAIAWFALALLAYGKKLSGHSSGSELVRTGRIETRTGTIRNSNLTEGNRPERIDFSWTHNAANFYFPSAFLTSEEMWANARKALKPGTSVDFKNYNFEHVVLELVANPGTSAAVEVLNLERSRQILANLPSPHQTRARVIMGMAVLIWLAFFLIDRKFLKPPIEAA